MNARIGVAAALVALMAVGCVGAAEKAAIEGLDAALALENAFVRVADDVGAAVVSISTSQERSLRVMYHEDPQVDQFLRQMYGEPNRGMRMQRRGLGSGMIINKKGDIMTNAHVVQDADKIIVTLADGRQYTCEMRGCDPRSELAIIRIIDRKDSDPELPVVKLGDSDMVKPGQWAIAVGNPFGITEESDDEPTLTVGVVSAIRTFPTPQKDFSKMIQTDAAINPGNSGGPLCNIKGEVIGINTFIISGGAQQNAGVSFAIPVNSAKAVMENLAEGREITYGWLGIDMQELDQGMADYFGLKTPSGVLVRDVVADGPAQKADIRSGDLIVSINGTKIKDPSHMLQVVTRIAVDSKTPIVVLRDGKETTLTATIGKRPAEGGVYKSAAPAAWRGMAVRNLLENEPQYKDKKGVLVERVEEESPAADAGLVVGDIVIAVGRKTIGSADDFATAVKGVKGPVLVRTERGFVVVKNSRERSK